MYVVAMDLVTLSNSLNTEDDINVHTAALVTGARRLAQLHVKFYGLDRVTGIDLNINCMMGRCDSKNGDGYDCTVLPSWFEIEKVQESLFIKSMTNRGFEVLQYNDTDETLIPFGLGWDRPYQPTTEFDQRRYTEMGWNVYPPKTNKVQF